MAAEIEQELGTGSLLCAPSDEKFEQLERLSSSYKPFNTFDLPKEKQYQQQYDDMYFLRLTMLKPIVEKVAAQAWDGFQIESGEVRKANRVLDVRQGELCWVSGTVYMELNGKPNILDDITRDHWTLDPPPLERYISSTSEDQTMLEDESGRLRLIGPALADEMIATGCVIAVMGTENENGDFEVLDIKVPGIPPQPARWSSSSPPTATDGSGRKAKRIKIEDADEDMGNDEPSSRGKIAIVSGLSFSGTNTEQSIQTNLLIEFLLGEALDPASQKAVSQINRLIIAGNSVASDNEALSHDIIGNSRKTHRKYGYDSSTYNPIPTAHLDNFLAALLPSLPVTLIPGASDPANISLPQQPIHAAMLPHSRPYVAQPASAADEEISPGWLDSVTNPWEAEIDGWRVLGTGGQNVDDIYKYVEIEDRLRMLEAICRWRCCAPTAPDTLLSYPFQDDDPFVLRACPHLLFAGSQPKFDTAVIEGPDGQVVRLIAIPKFAETGEVVLVDMETLEVERVIISVFDCTQ